MLLLMWCLPIIMPTLACDWLKFIVTILTIVIVMPVLMVYIKYT
jgi:hypothetical protein